MPELTSQDFQSGLDLTALTEVTASEIMQCVSTGRTADGKGLIIVTDDSALDTPVVPNPSDTVEGVEVTFWEYYIWVRRPHADAGIDVRVKFYIWDDRQAEHATLLFWQDQHDLAQIAYNLAQVAEGTGEAAQADATEALTGAATAQATANAAQTTATAAQTSVDTLAGRVTTNEATIANHEERIDALEADSSEEEDPVTPSSLGLSKVPINFTLLKETQLQGVDAGTFTNGAWRTRVLNLKEEVGTSFVTLNADGSFDLLRGSYLIEAEAPAFGVEKHQAKLYNESAGTDVAFGSSAYAQISGAPVQTSSKIYAKVTTIGTSAFSIKHQCEDTIPNNGLGQAANFGTEIYTQVKITKLYS